MRSRFTNFSLSMAQQVLFGLTAITLVLMAAYVCVRLTTLFAAGYTAADSVMAALLIGAELFLCFHGVGYFMSVVKAERHQRRTAPVLFANHPRGPGTTEPSVAVLVAAFNESADVLEETLASVSAMDYPAAHVYLIDDSTKTENQLGAARVAATYGAKLVHRTDRSGYKAGAINDLIPHLDEPYIALLDADQRPLASWLRDLVPYMEERPDLAFVQVPQVYVNTEGLPVAEAATYQQAVFFEYICEGKSDSNAMFCCGSNVIIRREALLSIGCEVKGRRHYFDETSVTEDFATSFRLHARGWRTDYVNQPYVVGMGPETLPAYFTQQMRWAMGTLAVGLQVGRQLLVNPRALRPAQWFEYLLSGSYYFVGFANFIFMLAPIMFMLFDVRPLRANSNLYLVFFVPYIAFTMNLFFFGMWLRSYSVRGIWLASALSFATFWIYMKAAIVALFGLKRAFGVTPKGVGGAIPVSQMWPELVMFCSNYLVVLWGTYHLATYGWSVGYAMNTLWAGYHALLLSTLFIYFNKPVTIAARRLLFEPAARAAAFTTEGFSMMSTSPASLGRSTGAAALTVLLTLLATPIASAQQPESVVLPSTALADQRTVPTTTLPPPMATAPAFWELISGYEGDSDGSGYAFFGPSFVRPIRPGLSWTARAFGNYLAYEFSGLEGVTHVRSPGISTGVGLQFGDKNFFRVLAGPEVKWRRTEITGVTGVTAAHSEARLGANAGGEVYTNPTSHNNLHGIANYNTTDKYSWARLGFKEQLNNQQWERPNTLFLGVEGIVQGNSDIRARQLGAFLEFSRAPARVSIVLKGGYKRSTFEVGPARTGPYFSIGFYRRMN